MQPYQTTIHTTVSYQSIISDKFYIGLIIFPDSFTKNFLILYEKEAKRSYINSRLIYAHKIINNSPCFIQETCSHGKITHLLGPRKKIQEG